MKIAIILVAVLAIALSASIKERSIPTFFEIAQQLIKKAGCNETEIDCETHKCPDIINTLDGNNGLITGIVCAGACTLVQELAKKYSNGPINGVDPCIPTP